MFNLKSYIFLLFVIGVIFALPSTALAQVDPNLRTRLQNQGAIVVDHTSLNLFDQIPDVYLQRARNLSIYFSDRSVGQNISDSLNCLSASSWATSPNDCRKAFYDTTNWCNKQYTQTDWNNGTVPEEIRFTPDPVKYNRSNIDYLFRMGGWWELTDHFVNTFFPSNIANYDIVTYQFSYLNIGGTPSENINIANPACGYMVTQNRASCTATLVPWHIGRVTELESQYPSKAFIYWTTSLARGIGSLSGQVFNQQMRDFAIQNRKILFDVADIISITPQGQRCYDDRDGIPYIRKALDSSTSICQPLRDQNGNIMQENKPDDGQNYPAICQLYTTEVDNGHFTLGGASIRVAKAYWILMAQIAGWVPGSVGPSPSPLPSIVPTPQPSVTPSPLISPTPSPARCLPLGDIDCSGKINSLDFGSIAKYWGTNTYIANLNNSGLVDGADARLLLNGYLQ